LLKKGRTKEKIVAVSGYFDPLLEKIKPYRPPRRTREILAYLFGVLKGDGHLRYRRKRSGEFCLNVKSKEFALRVFEAFKLLGLEPRLYEKLEERKVFDKCMNKVYEYYLKYYKVEVTIPRDLAENLESFRLETMEEKRAFVAGFFQSEGHWRIRHRRERYYSKRKNKQVIYEKTSYELTITNTNLGILEKIKQILKEFNVNMKIEAMKSRKKTCYRLVTYNHKNVSRFLQIFGGKEIARRKKRKDRSRKRLF